MSGHSAWCPIGLRAVIQSVLRDEQEQDIHVNGEKLKSIRYAGEAVIIAHSMEELQQLLDRDSEVGETYGLKLNIKKNKFMIIRNKRASLKD